MKRIILSLSLVLALAATSMAAPIGKITKFKGKAVVVNLDTSASVTKVGQLINKGDTIQTENGEVEVTFSDGALLKVRPYTTTAVDERTEKRGLFKNKEEDVRRVTCFVGKMYFKSGKSDKKNYVQSPTAVCALRGTIVEFASDGDKKAYLKLVEGAAKDIGKVLREAFPNIGASEAQKSAIFQAVKNASSTVAAAGGNATSQAKAQIKVQQAMQATQQAMQNNPDGKVAKYAKAATALVTAKLVESQANLQVAQAEAQAKTATTTAQKTAAAKAIADAKATAVAAAKIASTATQAIIDGKLGEAIKAANEALDLVKEDAVAAVDTTEVTTGEGDEADTTDIVEVIQVEVYEAQ